MKEIKPSSKKGVLEEGRLASSFRDPSGFLFYEKGELYRWVAPVYQEHFDRFMSSGLYDALVGENFLLPHEELREIPRHMEGAYKILKPRVIPFISYPYEWCFSQLKAAALLTLAIQKKALEFGMSLKDASCYNIQFLQGKPIFIDTLSFETYPEGKPWVAYGQFCRHFLAPLALMSFSDVRLAQLFRVFLDGIPLDLAQKLLPFRTRLNPSLFLHLHLHAKMQAQLAGKPAALKTSVLSKNNLLALLENLEDVIRGLDWNHKSTEWTEYYKETNYSVSSMEEKEKMVGEFLEHVKPHAVWDMGGNTGTFSRIASSKGSFTVSFDIDHGAVEQNYREMIAKRETNLLPLVLDLANPSSSLGWRGEERMSLMERGPVDLVLALALVHHLAISNNVPLQDLAAFFHELAPTIIIEFAPKEDSQVQKLLRTRADIFPNYTVSGFELAFGTYFRIQLKKRVPNTQRFLYLMTSI